MKRRAQTISEYVVLLAIISTALMAMQLYFRRSVCAVVKIAADQVGSQKQGAVTEASVEWIQKHDEMTTATSVGSNTEEKLPAGSVRYGSNDASFQEGGAYSGLFIPKED